MLDDTTNDSRVGPPSTTVWIENELRRLYKEGHEWQSRWYLLKTWIDKRRTADASTYDDYILDIIAAHMSELENDTPTWTTDYDKRTRRTSV